MHFYPVPGVPYALLPGARCPICSFTWCQVFLCTFTWCQVSHMHFYLVPGVPYALLPGARYLGYHRKVLNIWIGMIKLSIAVKGLRLLMAMLSYNRMTVSICSDGMMKCMIKLSIARYLRYHRKVLNIWIGTIKLSIAVKAMLSYNRMTVSICSDGMMKCMIKLSIAMKGLKKKHLTLQY